MGSRVVHFEVVTSGDVNELSTFYSEVFGWSNVDTNNEFNYGIVTAEDAGIGGGIGKTPDPNMPGHVTFYLEVDDPEATLQEIERRGGKRLMGPEEILPGTTIALFHDPHGHMIGLTKAAG
jgi:uncharacterized protein